MIFITGIIYKITNDVNSKVYIGKTLSTIEYRFSQHKSDYKKERLENRPLYRAMKKYGVEHFHIEKIEEVDANVLDIRENYWIEYYNSYHYGYNATKGGDGKQLFDHDKIISLIKQGVTSKNIREKIGCSQDLLRNIARVNNIELKNEESPTQKEIIERKKSVYQLDLNDNIIQKFESASSAAEWIYNKGYSKMENKAARNHVLAVCHGKRKVAYGFKWQFVDEVDKVIWK